MRNAARNKYIQWFILTYFLVVCFQYCDLWSSSVGEVTTQTYGKVSSDNLDNSGLFRYAKDVYLLIAFFIVPLAVMRARDLGLSRKVVGFLCFEAIMIAVTLIGHVIEPRLYLIVAGARWILLFNFSILLYILAQSGFVRMDSRGLLSPRAIFTLLNLFVALFVVMQWIAYGMPSISGVRFFGIFANAGVLGMASIGFAVMLFAIYQPSPRLIFLLMTTLAPAVLSGTRMAMLLIFILLTVSMFSMSIRGKAAYFIGIIRIFFVLAMFGLFPVVFNSVQTLADRGDLIAAQLGQGGRLSNIAALGDFLINQPWYKLIFGDGLGNGTNSAVTLAPDSANPSSWNRLIDNTILTLFFQGGILEVVLFLTLVTSIFVFAFRSVRGRGMIVRIHLMVIMLTFAGITLAGNVMESYTFMPFYFLALGIFVNRQNVKKMLPS